MEKGNTVLERVASRCDYLHALCGGEFLKAIYDLVNVTEGKVGEDVAKDFIQFFAEENEIQWEDAVEYLYQIMVEAKPDFCENFSSMLDWKNICLSDKAVAGEFVNIKGNEKYASKRLYELFCKRAGMDREMSTSEFLLDAYGWNNVAWLLVNFVIEEYLLVEERYEETEVAATTVEDEVEDTECLETSTPEVTEEEPEEVAPTELVAKEETITTYGERAVKAICISDGTTHIFNSRNEVAKALAISYGNITNAIRGQRKSCISKKDKKKYRFELLFPKKAKTVTLMVDAATKKVLKRYDKATDASREWDLNYDRLQGTLKNKTPEHHLLEGYEWWTESDYNKYYQAA